MVSDMVGRTVKNAGKALRLLLSVYFNFSNFRHTGNYVFSAELPDGSLVVISTVPIDGKEEQIRILSVDIHRSLKCRSLLP